MFVHPSPVSCLRLVEALLGVCSLVVFAELWSSRSNLKADGLLSWPLQRGVRPGVSRWLDRLGVQPFLNYPMVLALLGLRLAAAVVLLLCIYMGMPTAIPLTCLAGLAMVFALRQPYAQDGARQFALMGLIACAAGEWIGTPVAFRLTLLFLAAQASLAYATAGWLKLFQSGWWNGASVLYVLSSHDCAVPRLRTFFVSRRPLASGAGVLFVLGECFLSLAPVLPPGMCMVLLALGLLLHLSLARILGLNAFVWAFPASYPAVYFISCLLYRGHR